MRYIAKTLQGLEEVLEKELVEIGAKDCQILNRAVSFEADERTMYSVLYQSRLALHILRPLAEFTIETQQDLYNYVKDNIAWEKLFEVDTVMYLDTQCFDSVFTHSRFASQRVKDAIVDRFRAKFGRRPWVDSKDYKIRIDVYIKSNKVVISLDAAGVSLHQRGYKSQQGKAPLSEVLAAGLLYLSEWDKKKDLYDPMCGSGTIALEAALMANNIPAGYYRGEYSFLHWNDFDPNIWKEVKKDAEDQIKESDAFIYASDISETSIKLCKENLFASRLHTDVKLFKADFFKSKPPCKDGIIVCNPPYGQRLSLDWVEGFYKQIGDTLKQKYNGFEAYIFSASVEGMKNLGLKTHLKRSLINGDLPCKFWGYRMY